MADVGTKLVYENDRVKVWEFTLAAGEVFPEHTHELDYFFYVIEGSTFEVTRKDRVDTVPLREGTVHFRVRGDTHSARNVGATRYHEVLVELKDPGR
jgi:quercetin dioxygenase-like cupin family protein